MPKKKDETVVEPEVIQDKPQEQSGVTKLGHFEKKLAELKPYMDYTIKGLSDKEGRKRVDEARKEVKRERIKVEKEAESLKAPLAKLLGQIREQEKTLVKGFDEIEDNLDEKVKTHDKAKAEEEERIRQEAEARFNKRLDQINTLGAKWNGHTSYKIGEVAITSQEIRTLSDEQFIKITSLMEEEGIKEREQQRLEEERRAEEKRIADAEIVRMKEEAEKARLEKEKMEKELADALAALEKEKQERVNAEVERVRLEKEAEAAGKAEAVRVMTEKRKSEILSVFPSISLEGDSFMYQGFAILSLTDIHLDEDYWKDIASTFSTQKDQIDKAVEAEVQRAKEKEAARVLAAEEAAVKAEQERVAKEKADAERQELLKPDKEKLLIAAQKIADFPMKLAFTSEEAKSIHNQLIEKMSSISLWLQKETESL